MKKEVIRLSDISSTNDYLQQQPTPMPDAMTVAVASHQTAGRGQGSNRWESEAGKNLLFSILTSPVSVPVAQQFILSMAGALALKQVLDRYTGDITLKWPNDIYWLDTKICGMLLEHTLVGPQIDTTITGVGLNVNQVVFESDAPNPMSLRQITGSIFDREQLMRHIAWRFHRLYRRLLNGGEGTIHRAYLRRLYRRDGRRHRFRDANGDFEAEIKTVLPDGRLMLRDEKQKLRTYAFKEVQYLKDAPNLRFRNATPC